MEHIFGPQREAAKAVFAQLAKPLPKDEHDLHDATFDPWELFPAVYGGYSQAFDDMALEVLQSIQLAAEGRWDDIDYERETLAHELFREMLCTADLCEYGSSPRTCFGTEAFKPVLPDLIEKWRAYSAIVWS